jgi:hypothetical protein
MPSAKSPESELQAIASRPFTLVSDQPYQVAEL